MSHINALWTWRECGLCHEDIPPGYRHVRKNLPACRLQDMRTLRTSGVCVTCGASAYELHFQGEPDAKFELVGSGHYDGDADHEVRVTGQPVNQAIDAAFQRIGENK